MTKRFDQLREQMTPERRERNEAEAEAEREQMDATIHCPHYRQGRQCTGMLRFLVSRMTSLGTHQGVDGNTFTELYCCDTCNSRVMRRYRWEPAEEAHEDGGDSMMAARIQCPRYRQGQQCCGMLKFVAGQMTLLGTIEGVDGNEFFEVYCCDTCCGQVSRSYRWEPIAVDIPVDEEADITS